MACYMAIVYVLLYALASIVATVFQCTPVSRAWNHAIEGRCINLTQFWYTNAGQNILGDFSILALPLLPIWDLQLPRRHKWGLTLVFLLGFLCAYSNFYRGQADHCSVCVTSILRMTTLDTSSKSKDQTYGSLNSTVWTTVESNTAIICACLPMLKLPLTLACPRLFPRSRGYASDATPPHRNSGPYRVPLVAVPVPTAGNSGRKNSHNLAFGKGPDDIPLGQIVRTTDVDVDYGRDHDRPEYPSRDMLRGNEAGFSGVVHQSFSIL